MKHFNGPRFIIKMIVGTIVCTLLMSVGVMLLWNWLIPDIFHGPKINYLQALGLLALAKVFFGLGFKGGGCGGGHCGSGGGHQGFKGYMRQKWEDKLSRMSPEERERAKEKYKNCCGPWDKADEGSCKE